MFWLVWCGPYCNPRSGPYGEDQGNRVLRREHRYIAENRVSGPKLRFGPDTLFSGKVRNYSGEPRHGRNAGKNAIEGSQDILILLAQGGEIAADDAKDFGAAPRAKAAGDFLANLGHTQVALGQVIVEGDAKIVHKSEHGRRMIFQPEQ